MRKIVLLACILLIAGVDSAWTQTIAGDLTGRFRGRWGGEGYEDRDLYTYLRMTFSDSNEKNRFSGALSLRWDVDLMTRNNEIDDGDNDLRIYTAYLDINATKSSVFRLGRMILDDAEGFQVTGARGTFKLSDRKYKIGVFGGQPVSFYTNVSGDWTAGATFAMKPDRFSRLRGSYVHVEEELGENDVVTASYRRSDPRGWSFWGTVRTIDFDIWNELIGGSYRIAPWDLSINGSYRRQEDTNDLTSRYFSQFASTLGSTLPYHRLTLSLNRPFGELLSLGAGLNRRELLKSAAENYGNAEYTRFFFDVYLLEKLLWGFEANFDVSRWYTDDDSNTTLSGSLSRRLGEQWRFDLGSYYAKYDIRQRYGSPDEPVIERYDVRSYYLRGDFRVRKKYRLQLEVERGTDATSDDPFYQVELRFGLDLGFISRGFSS